MKDIKKVLDFLTGKKQKRAQQEAEASRQRIEDLYIKYHQFNDEISIPIPNLFAEAQIEKHFGSKDKIDFDDNEHIAWLLYILRNQENLQLIHCTKKEQLISVREIMQEIPVNQKELYQQAIWEMFMALKKNSNQRERELLQPLADMLSLGQT